MILLPSKPPKQQWRAIAASCVPQQNQGIRTIKFIYAEFFLIYSVILRSAFSFEPGLGAIEPENCSLHV
ncbi:hypothetical protein QT972_21445 [Microcoleus sp. herbarium7]